MTKNLEHMIHPIGGHRPLRITHVITSLTVGGAQQLLLDICLEMRAHGHDVRVIGLRGGSMAQEFRKRGFETSEFLMENMVSLPTLFRLTVLLKQQRPWIVHTHLGRADSYGRVAAWLAGVPRIVTTVHNVDAWKAKWYLRWIDAVTSRAAHRLIACSGRVAEHLRAIGLVPMDKVTVLRNGIRLQDWRDEPSPVAVSALRQDLGVKNNEFVIGVIGRLEPQKGHVYLLQALASFKSSLPAFRLCIVGEGTLREELERLVVKFGLASNVTFAGVRHDMRLVYAAVDLVVMPSLWEGLPITLLECMASRRPVVATDVGGISEIIQPEHNGLMVPPKSSEALAAAIQRCMQSPESTRARVEAGFETVRREFSVEQLVDKVLALYRQLDAAFTAGQALKPPPSAANAGNAASAGLPVAGKSRLRPARKA